MSNARRLDLKPIARTPNMQKLGVLDFTIAGYYSGAGNAATYYKRSADGNRNRCHGKYVPGYETDVRFQYEGKSDTGIRRWRVSTSRTQACDRGYVDLQTCRLMQCVEYENPSKEEVYIVDSRAEADRIFARIEKDENIRGVGSLKRIRD